MPMNFCLSHTLHMHTTHIRTSDVLICACHGHYYNCSHGTATCDPTFIFCAIIKCCKCVCMKVHTSCFYIYRSGTLRVSDL